MTEWRKGNYSLVLSWTALIGGSLIVFWAGRGTQFHQLGIGLLSASVALLVAMTIFEIVWQVVTKAFNIPDEEQMFQDKESSTYRERERSGRRS